MLMVAHAPAITSMSSPGAALLTHNSQSRAVLAPCGSKIVVARLLLLVAVAVAVVSLKAGMLHVHFCHSSRGSTYRCSELDRMPGVRRCRRSHRAVTRLSCVVLTVGKGRDAIYLEWR